MISRESLCLFKDPSPHHGLFCSFSSFILSIFSPPLERRIIAIESWKNIYLFLLFSSLFTHFSLRGRVGAPLEFFSSSWNLEKEHLEGRNHTFEVEGSTLEG
jgi:hypothetical protein